MRLLLLQAYALQDYQLTGPSWMDTRKYDIEVKVPSGVTRGQFKLMMQDLLVQRFGVKVHHETKVFSGYELVVAKDGPKLTPPQSASAETAALIAAGARGPAIRKTDKDGLPELPAGANRTLLANIPGGVRLSARGQGLDVLVGQLETSFVKVPVRDATGLAGKYDFNLTFSRPFARDGPDIPLPDIFTALREQLGLSLEARKLSIDVVVVDRAEKEPTED